MKEEKPNENGIAFDDSITDALSSRRPPIWLHAANSPSAFWQLFSIASAHASPFDSSIIIYIKASLCLRYPGVSSSVVNIHILDGCTAIRVAQDGPCLYDELVLDGDNRSITHLTLLLACQLLSRVMVPQHPLCNRLTVTSILFTVTLASVRYGKMVFGGRLGLFHGS